MRRRAQLKRYQRGSTLMEFALILPAFLLLTVGVVDFGRGIWTYHTLSHAAREGARYAIVRGANSRHPASSSEIGEVVQSRTGGLDPQKLVVTASWDPDNKPGSAVQVRVQYNFRPVTPLFSSETLVLSSRSQMVISQ